MGPVQKGNLRQGAMLIVRRRPRLLYMHPTYQLGRYVLTVMLPSLVRTRARRTTRRRVPCPAPLVLPPLPPFWW